jgi:predicted dehydrogenase
MPNTFKKFMFANKSKETRASPAAVEPKMNVLPPPRPEMSASPPRILIIGAGSRGRSYAEAIIQSCNGLVVAVAEPDDYKRENLGLTKIWGIDGPPAEGAQFRGWKEFVDYEKQRRARAAAGEANVPPGVDAAFVCVQDEMHREVVVALAELGGIHIMCEKPLATTLDDCKTMYSALQGNQGKVFSIGHVLRYSPHNMMLRKLLLEDRVIGDVLSIVHTEPVGWWHFTHSYVRGNWRRESTSAPSLLTKSCHDIDVLLWLLCSPPSYDDTDTPPHLPSTVSSSGALQYFKKSRKPVAAGGATNCLSCPVETSCKYSAKRIYVDKTLHGLGTGNTHWPVSIVVPDIEDFEKRGGSKAAEEALVAKLAEDYDAGSTPDAEVAARNWFGRCVYEADNDVCDEQIVTVTWDEDPLPSPHDSSSTDGTSDPMRGRGAKTATFHMVAQTRQICDRYTHIYGVDGEIYADSHTIAVTDFRSGGVSGQTTTHQPRMESLGHGGGDVGLVRQFILAVDKVKNHGWDADRAQRELIGCTLEEVIRSHAMVFCAEEARREKKVVDWKKWWEQKVGT